MQEFKNVSIIEQKFEEREIVITHYPGGKTPAKIVRIPFDEANSIEIGTGVRKVASIESNSKNLLIRFVHGFQVTAELHPRRGPTGRLIRVR